MQPVRPQTGGREPILDGWRGLALLGVLIDHFVTRSGLNLGRFGVELFFVLSGRLMAEILFVRQAPLGEFFFRRFTRIYPVLFCFATLLFLQSKFMADMIMPAAFASVLTLTANYFSVLSMRTHGYDHIWSLCIEQHAYVILGLIAWAHRRLRLPPLRTILTLAALAILDGMISTWAFGQRYNDVYWRTDVRGASILIGAALFIMLHDAARRPAFLGASWFCVTAGAAALLLNINVVPDPIKYSLGTILVALCLDTIDGAPTWLRRMLSSGFLAGLGTVSYSIYVWQEPFAEIPDPTRRLLLLPVALACGLLSFFLVEGPARRGLNRLWSQAKSAVQRPQAQSSPSGSA